MPSITNKTRRPLAVPLPGGKRLHLGPGKTGQITPKALEFEPVAKLVEAGELEVVGEDRQREKGSGGGSKVRPSDSHRPSTGGIQHTGDR